MVAQRTLTPYVRVRILLPLPSKSSSPTWAGCSFFAYSIDLCGFLCKIDIEMCVFCGLKHIEMCCFYRSVSIEMYGMPECFCEE